MELKNSLLMPKTNFEMRGNLSQKEPILVKKWQDEKLYEQMLELRKGSEEYAFHDGPPYANGDIHCGHMLNRILKDMIVRYKVMSGYYVPFIFGFDTHGLPIEVQVTKSGVNRKLTPPDEFRQKCREYALKQVEHQKSQIVRLGAIGDYEHAYLTLNKDFEVQQIEVFVKMALRGLIYKGLKPVYWSWSSESALAEAEIEYKDVKSYAIYVAFNVKDGKGVVPAGSRAVIWTTTPWTLPANLAISVHPRFEYGLYKTNLGNLILLKEFEERLTTELGLTQCELLKTFKGQDLEGVKTSHPFYDRESVILVGEHVTNESGTGLVHTAPGHGVDDFTVCQKYGIQPYCPVDEHGKLTADCGDKLAGLFYEDANKTVLEIIQNNGSLLKCDEIVHSYPHDWRTGKPVIFRATPQWFCSIGKIKDELLSEVQKVNWQPSWGKERISNMIKDRTDWCISRQRIWGVPIPIIYAEDGTPITEKEVFDSIVSKFKEFGSDIWFTKDAYYFLPEGYKNAHSPNGVFTKEKDIMDVWFDSGSSFNAVMINGGHKFPCDLYLEGADQFRGWFNSSLSVSVSCYDKAPYETVVSHGWVLDEKGEKMSKSKGNGIDPNKMANIYGADILRLWVSTVNYQQDVRISENLLKQVAEQYRKIRNTFKFLLGNLSNGEMSKFDPKKDMVNEFAAVDKFILAKLEDVKNSVIESFDHFDFASALTKIMTFMSSDLSSFYLDIGKDILYCESAKSLRRKQMQSVIYLLTSDLMRMLAPVLPFTMEEVHTNMPDYNNKSVALLDYPKESHKFDKSILEQYESFLAYRNDVNKAIEDIRAKNIVGSSQEALIVTPDVAVLKETGLDKDLSELAKLLIVSKVELNPSLKQVEAHRIDAVKCPRCWNYVDKLVKVDDEVEVCERCAGVLKNE
ncbi:MAG: isoleucine--tRNA ligase [Bacilli bacterium]|nr:isoleucine--tRNA ligase [Bacilli bacterium]